VRVQVIVKIYENLESGQLVSFEIRNVGRSRACRIVQELLPSAVVTRQRGDEFATFAMNGKPFVIEEPFGDNSRYLIYEQPPQPSAELEALKSSFERYRASWLFSGDKSFRAIVVVLALTTVAITVAIMLLSR
jgi:hypothetical protein